MIPVGPGIFWQNFAVDKPSDIVFLFDYNFSVMGTTFPRRTPLQYLFSEVKRFGYVLDELAYSGQNLITYS